METGIMSEFVRILDYSPSYAEVSTVASKLGWAVYS